MQVNFLKMGLKRAREENIDLRSETRVHEKHYDTTAPADTVTGKQPVLREIISSTDSRYGKVIEEDEMQHGEVSTARENLVLEDRNRVLTVNKRTREDKALKEKTSVTRFNYKLSSSRNDNRYRNYAAIETYQGHLMEHFGDPISDL